ncbi:MAG TPA: tetratricopeptide repeat protein, partial [Gemmatimonadaceae bacterium]|nr:tetratricopeptide repeat protein [Gemmatimonadaceae bacterium]
FEHATSIDSSSFQAWQSLGIVSVLARDWPRAADAFHHSLRANPGNLDAYAGLARAEINIGQLDSAAVHVARIGSADPEALWMLGERLLSQHRSRDAQQYLERSAAAAPWGRGAALLSVAYAENGEISAAVSAADAATRNAPQSPAAFTFAGVAMRLAHRASAAQAYLQHALVLDPSDTAARAELDSLRSR